MAQWTFTSFCRGVYYLALSLLAALTVFSVPLLRKLYKSLVKGQSRVPGVQRTESISRFLGNLRPQARHLNARDGVRINYYVLFPDVRTRTKRIVVICSYACTCLHMLIVANCR